tara:strand:+ start:193 stop:405 length:213 start_codon:yes stop_codon:yes gene_type:complete
MESGANSSGMSGRMLSGLATEGWPQDLLDMLYLNEEILARAKRGTAVRNISLTSNPEKIEGRVSGVRIVY